MPPGRTSRLGRRVGLARSRQLLRRSLALHATAGASPLATVIARPKATARSSL